ncbi:Asp domain-containing protein [Cephalotus follicularis]|uniref:Asp domain-containing protein n=1 Tax=Cephalotus follicularis TaxID=3775 RepID=A0A1Q3AXJ2_CEPFO|nr:Asp domain-containing protein [Cephalotus follicularis]
MLRVYIQALPLNPTITVLSLVAALCKETMLLFILLFFTSLPLSFQVQEQTQNQNKSISLSFPLTYTTFSTQNLTTLYPFVSQTKKNPRLETTLSSSSSSSSPRKSYRLSFKYTQALIVSLPIGTPPQIQQMVLDTGSQLSWIQCHNKRFTAKPPPATSFDPSRSSSFSVLPCNHPLCKPRIPDFTLPTSCDQNRLCHYSYFYADGTLAEGNLVREKFTFSPSQSTPPLILGCATASADDRGILGMNRGRLSFASQAKISKFSYCVPTRRIQIGFIPTGSFYLGENPKSGMFRYVSLLTFAESQRMPNLDPLAYTLPMQGLRIGTKKLDIPVPVFRPGPNGAGQTMIDSGSEFTYLVDEAYNVLREEIVRLVGPRIKKGYVYGGVCDMCFERDAMEIGRLIGDMVFEFEKGVEIAVEKERILADVGGGVHCLGIGRSDMLGIASNIIGNVHQQNLWVEFDLANRRVGFGKADCSRSS